MPLTHSFLSSILNHFADMSAQQPVYHPPASSTMIVTTQPKTSTADLYNVPTSSSTDTTSTSNYTGDWSRDLNIAANIMDEALQKNTAEKKRFLSFEEITADDSSAMKNSQEGGQENGDGGV